MGILAHALFALVALAALVLMVRYFMRTALMCQFCGDPDCKVWDRVPEETQGEILDYFRTYERREPDTAGLFVCDACRTVFDDFSGEKASRDLDYASGSRKRTIVSCRAWCKVCNSLMECCDPDNKDIRCRACGTRHEWKTHERSGYRFLMPPEGAELLERCSDLHGCA